MSKAGTTRSMSKIRNSAFYPLHPQISSAKIIRILPVSTSARPQICTSAFYHWPQAGAANSINEQTNEVYVSSFASGVHL